MKTKILPILNEVFWNADPETLETLHTHGTLKTYPANTLLVEEGALEHTFYIIIDGAVDIFRYQHGERMSLDRVENGQTFGELALILDAPRSATCITVKETSVFEINRLDFNRFIKSEPKVLVTLVQFIIRRILLQEDRRMVFMAKKQKRDNPSPTVFVSYARSDEQFIRRIAGDLSTHDIPVWVDIFNIDSGKSWARQIGDALDACKVMLLVISENAMTSENVEDEWNYYLDKGKLIVPIRYQKCDIPYRLHKLHYIDFVEPEYELAFNELLADLRLKTE